MKEKLIDVKQLKQLMPGKINTPFKERVVRMALRVFGFEKVNKLYDNSKHLRSRQFVDSIFKELGITVKVENPQVLERFSDGGGVLFACNHPYGHLDSMSLLKTVVKVRPDYKTTANFILALIDTMSEHFITMDPYAKKGEIRESAFDSVKECLDHVRAGHPLGFFPAGKISYVRACKGRLRVEDTEWRTQTVRIMQRTKAPIIPVFFPGRNSWSFYWIGRIFGWKMRYTRLIAELYNKRGKTIVLRFGEPIMPEQIKGMKPEELSHFLFDKVYALRQDADRSIK